MKKLMHKTYIVLFSLLTLFLLTISFVFNYQFYIKERNEVEYNLVRISKAHNSFNFFLNKPIIIDNIAYVVNFDENFNVDSIINYTDKKINEKEIVYLAKKFIKSNKEMMVGNLYLSGYSYFLDNRNSLIILDNSIVNKRLKSLLNVSLISLVLLEIVVLYVSYALTKWLVKPVNEAFQKQNEFIYDASHELKTPLAVILSNAEMLESEPNEEKWINNIKSESIRMNKLVTDLLDLSRSENNVNSEKYSVEDISKSLEKMCLTFESLTFEKGLKLKSNIDKDIMLKCDIEKIKQLFTILMDNAIKYGDKKSTITVNLNKKRDNIILEVINKGKEIPLSEREKIFERFYKSDKSRNRNDNHYGIGLAIAKNIVSNYNGNINVECNNGYTKFSVILKNKD